MSARDKGKLLILCDDEILLNLDGRIEIENKLLLVSTNNQL